MEEILLAVISIVMVCGFAIATIWIFKHAQFVFILTSKKTVKGKWLLFKNKLKNGKITFDEASYLVDKSEPFILEHRLLGHIPAFFFMENNPEPMDMTKKFPKSKMTASAIQKMGKMAAVEKIMEASKPDFTERLMFLGIGAALGAMLVFALLYMGLIEIPAGLCLTNPEVISMAQNMGSTTVVN